VTIIPSSLYHITKTTMPYSSLKYQTRDHTLESSALYRFFQLLFVTRYCCRLISSESVIKSEHPVRPITNFTFQYTLAYYLDTRAIHIQRNDD